MKSSAKTKLGKILFIVSMPIVFGCILLLHLEIEILQKYYWYISGAGLAMAIPALVGARIMDKSLRLGIKVRAIVARRGDTGATGVVSGNIVFETEQGEIIVLRASKIEYDALSENDVGVLHYKPIQDKLTKFIKSLFGHSKDEKENHFIKFEGEGKSANPFGIRADEECKNCGAAIHYNKFYSHTICEHCAGSDNTRIRNNKRANPSLSKIGHAIMIVSAFLFVSCFFTTVQMLIRSSTKQFRLFWHIAGFGAVCAIAFAALYILGSILWHKALPVVKERAFVERRGKLGAFLGKIVFETEQKESVTLEVEEDSYKSILEGDVGILYYKLDAKNLKSFKKFEREGKSAALTGTANTNCKNCGAAIHVEKYKFSIQIICEHCGNIVTK